MRRNHRVEVNTLMDPPREEGNKDPTKFPRGIQCHKCRGWGHMMRECPNRLNVLVQGWELYICKRVALGGFWRGNPRRG